jgi:3-hydroxybutyryl-CoA dehydrogenase
MISTVGIVGAGQMGGGIANLFARHGYRMLLCDRDEGQLARAVAAVRSDLARHPPAEAAADEVVARITVTSSIDTFAAADFVVEAVPEDERLKREVFRQLDAVVRPGVILATNTSAIPIASIAAATGRPDRVIGMHFMHPVPVMPLVEVIRGAATSEATFAVTAGLVAGLGKEMAVARDLPGFIVNRILIPMINEAVFALEDGVATAEDIDKAMRLGTNQPMGPLALADFIGIDTVLAIAGVLHERFGDPKYRPCPRLERMVAAGELGRKSGRGFFTY